MNVAYAFVLAPPEKEITDAFMRASFGPDRHVQPDVRVESFETKEKMLARVAEVAGRLWDLQEEAQQPALPGTPIPGVCGYPICAHDYCGKPLPCPEHGE